MKERREIQAVQDRLMEASQVMKQLDSFKLESTQESQAMMGYYLREASTKTTFEKNEEDIELSIVKDNEDEHEVGVYRVSNGDEYVKETEEGSQSEGEWIREDWQVEENDFYLFQVDEGLRSFHMPDFAAYLEELAEQYADELEVEERGESTAFILTADETLRENGWFERYERFSVVSQHANTFLPRRPADDTFRELDYQLIITLHNETNQLTEISIRVDGRSVYGSEWFERGEVQFVY